ncbi:hypothetical protein PC116_g8222 [Phytophthora cactorum]|nr:hypothetical protein PC114_g7259 [Phytophthora cactorum]KAG4243927.1 hypothetical protein PC116_g8222 [Phytophthora cactorum]
MASLLLEQLSTKSAVDDAIRGTKDRVLVLRFGRASDTVCLQQDHILARCERELSKMARHMKVDYSTPDHTKFIGAFRTKQDFIDLVEVIYRGAKHDLALVDLSSCTTFVHRPRWLAIPGSGAAAVSAERQLLVLTRPGSRSGWKSFVDVKVMMTYKSFCVGWVESQRLLVVFASSLVLLKISRSVSSPHVVLC